jgi:hypothetical protein
MNIRYAAALVLVVAVAFSPVYGFGESAEELYSACKPVAEAKVRGGQIDFEQNFETGECWGAFSALARISQYVNSATGREFIKNCVPEGSTRSELIAVFVDYVRHHPERRHDDFVDVTLESWRMAFCKAH